ncbi:methyltransferase domain-containing protein [Candidatus Calescamantes bacterium]|nr:methyltransferase domain-containing protein [Candidatus Calescamantes bacterium]
MDVLEHIPNDKKAVEECLRILKPEGCLIVTAPAFPFLFSS